MFDKWEKRVQVKLETGAIRLLWEVLWPRERIVSKGPKSLRVA